ncbi:hypothetical protein M878_00355 [Streptomyces roseochromogenus subsp. oscitans DS 12.976]|uniref:Uncharacterized protein n=1 Tax=Streptomyces roseochromogenus subsp. oscitans DS 12.976 TaxID=1352936 RepID=V6KXD5_STRRC|nr:hypothetical protein M878_00355 [Streptomyces roseochromogenus subsp. oscitans DS 12.976]
MVRAVVYDRDGGACVRRGAREEWINQDQLTMQDRV